MKQFEAELRTAAKKPYPRGLPLALHVEYQVNGTPWVSKGKKAPPMWWHVAAPGAPAIATLVAKAAVALGLCAAGQITMMTVSKNSTEGPAKLLVCFEPLSLVAADKDVKTKRHKLLEWFINNCVQEGREPTKVGFNALLRKLKKEADADPSFANASLDNVADLLSKK